MFRAPRIRLAALAALAVACSGLAATEAQVSSATLSDHDRTNVRRCVEYILMGPQYNGISIGGQGFNCKPVGAITVLGDGSMEIGGQLSHQLTARPDDQVNFKIRVAANGRIQDIRQQIDRGGFTSLPGRLWNATATWALPEWSIGLGSAIIDGVFSRLGGDIHNWRTGADLIVTTVAMEFSRSVQQRNLADAPAYFYDRAGSDLAQFDIKPNGAGLPGARPGELLEQVTRCQEACKRRQDCRSVTILRPQASRRYPQCLLKGDGTQPALHRDGVSILVREPPMTLAPIQDQRFQIMPRPQ